MGGKRRKTTGDAMRKSGPEAKLPHLDHRARGPLSKVVETLLADAGRPKPLAVSHDFFELMDLADGYEQQGRIYAAYEAFYEQSLAELTHVLGKPVWCGSWEDRGYPDWASGERVAVWELEGTPFSLALHHEDKELPIVVELRPGPRPAKPAAPARARRSRT